MLTNGWGSEIKGITVAAFQILEILVQFCGKLSRKHQRIHQTWLLWIGQIQNGHRMMLDQKPLHNTMKLNWLLLKTISSNNIYTGSYIDKDLSTGLNQILIKNHIHGIVCKLSDISCVIALIFLPDSESVSAALPDQRSPCNNAGLIINPLNRFGNFGNSCVHNWRAWQSPYYLHKSIIN